MGFSWSFESSKRSSFPARPVVKHGRTRLVPKVMGVSFREFQWNRSE